MQHVHRGPVLGPAPRADAGVGAQQPETFVDPAHGEPRTGGDGLQGLPQLALLDEHGCDHLGDRPHVLGHGQPLPPVGQHGLRGAYRRETAEGRPLVEDEGVEPVRDAFQCVHHRLLHGEGRLLGGEGGLLGGEHLPLQRDGRTLAFGQRLVQFEVVRLQPDDRLGDLVRHGVGDGGARFEGLHLGLVQRVRPLALHGLDDFGDPLLEGGAGRFGAGVDEEDETLQRDHVQVSTPPPACGNAETVTSSYSLEQFSVLIGNVICEGLSRVAVSEFLAHVHRRKPVASVRHGQSAHPGAGGRVDEVAGVDRLVARAGVLPLAGFVHGNHLRRGT